MKKIIIMGASSGIGLAVARALLTADIRLGLGARNLLPLRKLKDEFPDKVEYEHIDITDPLAPIALNSLIERLGGMDIYFHCSGIGSSNPQLDIETETRIIDVNVTGFARMLSAAFNYFRSTGRRGQIAAITSVAGTKGIAAMSAYSASKSFDSTYITALDQLAHRQGLKIDFTDIRPGWTATPLLKKDSAYPLLMTTEHVTAHILRAIALHKRIAIIDWRWSLLAGLWRLLPDKLWARLPLDIEI